MSSTTTTSSPIEQLIACVEADPPFDIYARRSVIAAARAWVADSIEVASEAAVEVENLTDKDNPVARRLRAKVREMEGAA